MRCYLLIALALLLISAQPLLADDAFVWWEAESAAQHNFPKTSGLAARNLQRREVLSGNDWLSISQHRNDANAPIFAKYRVRVPADGQYQFWARKFWKHGPFRWRFDEGDWSTVGRDVALADAAAIQTFVEANWVHAGAVPLKQGDHTLEIQLIGNDGEELTAAFDCFVLTTGEFVPRGKLKPGDKSGQADEGFFPYEPALDPFTDHALLDLRYLNEKSAGESGFLRRDGDRFLLGDGTPVRFWAMNVSRENAARGRASVDYMARRLAKAGVNMVRFHSSLVDGTDPSSDANDKLLNDVFYLVTAMKRNGIYTKLSFYFPLWFQVPQGYESIENKHPFGLLYFDAAMQERYRAWTKKLLDAPNPYADGMTLAQDPAVGMVEILNEDSLFFWTFGPKNIPPAHWQALETRFGRWLAGKYGSVEKAFDAWDGAAHDRDDADAGRAGLFDAWHMTREGINKGGSAKRRRISDQIEFLARLQRDFYASTVNYFKNDLHVGGLVTTSNWKTADAPLLAAIERWTYTAGDAIDRHGYFGGKHEGDGAAWSVRVGHRYEDRAAVLSPTALPIQFQQVAGYPQIISELGWTTPNRYRADATLLCSAYGSLQGVDGLFFFAMGSNYFADTTIGKFAASSPVIAATFPAAALQYRRGDVQLAVPAVFQALKLADLFDLKGSAVADADALDELRKRDVPPTAVIQGEVSGFDPRAFYVGPVVEAVDDTGQSWQRDLRAYVDPGHKTIRSETNQLRWDYGKGFVRVDTPNSQAAAGFLKGAGPVQLANVSIDGRNEFGSIVVISLDDKPIRESGKLLIQAMTEERPLGFKATNGVIEDLGTAPFGIGKIDATISLDVDAFTSAEVAVLDENGYPRPDQKPAASRENNTLRLQLLPDAIHSVVTVRR